MTQNVYSKAHDQIDVLVSIQVDDLGAVGFTEVDRIGEHEFTVSSYPSGKDLAGFFVHGPRSFRPIPEFNFENAGGHIGYLLCSILIKSK